MENEKLDVVLGSLDQIQKSIRQIQDILSPPAPIPNLIRLNDPGHISRALRGGVNEFLADGSMKVTYPVNEAEGGVAVRVAYPNRVLTEFDILFEAPFDYAQGLKIYRVQSFNEAIGRNDWDVILVACGSAAQAGHSPMVRLEAARNGGSWWGSANFAFSTNVWHRVAVELSKGSVDKTASGSFRVLVDGIVILNLPAVEVIRGASAFADGPINRLHLGGWYSNGARGNPTPDPSTPASLRIKNVRHSGS
jgi:hypothetical protein